MAAYGGEPTGWRRLAPLLILLLVIVLGYALRIHNLDAFSFWTDEGLTPERSGYPIAQILRNDILIQGVVTKDTHPPLYYLILHVTRQWFGLSDFAFRYPSVLFGVLLIPLIYQVGRRMGNVTLGLIVALLATVNPLLVYYSQEARMYSLLALLVTGMSYVLWRAIDPIRDTKYEIRNSGSPSISRISHLVSPSGGLLLYSLLAGLAVYTHYTVVFLIAAQALFWAWLLWRAGLKWVILGTVVLAALAAIPLIPYTVPRLLAGAEANYYTVSPLTMALDVIRFFNLGLTVDFGRPIVIALNLLAFGLLLLGLWGARRWRTRLFLLAWLLAVVLGLMAGSMLFKPMYQGVRHIMAGSPAFLVLVGFGIWVIWNWLPESWHKPVDKPSEELTGWPAWVADAPRANPLAFIPLILLLLGSAIALFNLYANTDYVKDDFRAIIRFIETRAGDRDAIVYNNAVLLPLHEHYRRRPDIAVTALPVYPQFATGEEPELAALARDYDRIWFITDPPADKRDENKLILSWLNANQTEVINRLFPARTTEARVIGYRTIADRRPPTAVTSEWVELPELTGVTFESPLEWPTLWVDLLWEGERPVVNSSLLFTLTGPDGQEYYRQARALLPDVDTRWDAEAINHLSYDLPLPPGTPPGTYTLAVTPESRETVTLGEIDIGSTDAWPAAPEALFADGDLAAVNGRRSAITFPNGLSLAATIPWDDSVLPGNNLPVTLYWRVGPEGTDLSDLRYRLEVIAADGSVLRVQEDRPGAPWLENVSAGALLREDTGLYIRPDTEPGDYSLRWTMLDGDTPISEPVTSGRITVEPWPLETDIPAAPYVVEAAFGPAIRMHSYNMGVPTDGLLNMTFYWQALSEPENDYMIFIHLVDDASQIVSQIDAVPVGGARPTSGWREGEVISDTHNLPIPDDLPPGLYRLNAGLFDPEDGSRPAVTMDGVVQPDNQLQLTTLELPWGEP